MELTITEFVWWVLIASGALVLGCALFSRYLHARTERRALTRRVVCRLCLHAFEDSSPDRIIACPACHTPNERSGA